MSDELPCAEQSIAVGEPLAGTAVDETDRWLLLEHDAAWGPKGLEDSELPPALLALGGALSKRFPRLRIQLVRRPGARASARGRLFLAESGEQAAKLSRLSLGSPTELLDVPLAAWLDGQAPMPGEPLHEPHYFVCVHGKRDRCCARLGVPVYKAFEEGVGPRVFQTTHLGGHRFAATLLVLPVGLCYGRVAADEVPALIAAAERGEIYDLGRLRGRTAYPSEAQAAEILLRAELGNRAGLGLSLRALEDAGERGTRVSFAEQGTGRVHELFVARAALPAASQSCGAKPKSAERLIALSAKPAASA